MEVDAYCRVAFASEEAWRLALALLEGDPAAPVFEEEVEPGCRRTFAVIETLEAPASVTALEGECALLLHWLLGSATEAERCLEELCGAGVVSLTALVRGDEGSVGGWRLTSAGLVRVGRVGGKALGSVVRRTGHPLTVLERMARAGTAMD